MAILDSRHHALIQALLARGPLHEKEVKFLFKTVCENNADVSEGSFHKCIGRINEGLDFVQLEARAGRNQYDGEIYYGVVNKVADEHAKLGTQYSLPQIAFFKAVIEAILQDQSGKGQILNIEALNIRLDTQVKQESQGDPGQVPLAFKQFSMAQKDKTLEDLVKNRWLCATEEGKIGLGIRSFLELRSLFKNLDVPFCDVCNEAGIKAELCQNEECSVRMHDYCLKRRFQHPQVARVCPSCGAKWECSGLNTEVPDLNEAMAYQDTHRVSHVPKRQRSSRPLRH